MCGCSWSLCTATQVGLTASGNMPEDDREAIGMLSFACPSQVIPCLMIMLSSCTSCDSCQKCFHGCNASSTLCTLQLSNQ
jgi:hypothetical protein